MADRALAEKRCATPRGAHRRSGLGGRERRLLEIGSVAARSERALRRNEDVEHCLLARLAFAARAHSGDRRLEGGCDFSARGLDRKLLAERKEERAIERP